MVTSDVLTWLLAAVSTVAGTTSFVTIFMYRGQTKRLKNAEAFEKEVSALRETIGVLQKQFEWLECRLIDTQSLVVTKDAYITQLSQEKHVLEIKNSKNKNAINQAYSCEFCDTHSLCPVLLRRATHEDEYLKQIERNNNVDSGN